MSKRKRKRDGGRGKGMKRQNRCHDSILLNSHLKNDKRRNLVERQIFGINFEFFFLSFSRMMKQHNCFALQSNLALEFDRKKNLTTEEQNEFNCFMEI